jgi:hypothetical protein
MKKKFIEKIKSFTMMEKNILEGVAEKKAV